MKNLLPFFLFFFVAILIFSCTKNASLPSPGSGNPPDTSKTVTGSGSANVDIYVVGSEDDVVTGAPYTRACYWKNGVKTILPGEGESVAFAVQVVGSDVYIGGFIGTKPETAAVWKNGQLTTITDAQTMRVSALAASNNTLYVGMWEFTYSNGPINADYLAVSGSGSVESGLTDTENRPNINSMFASGNTVYSAGNGYDVFTANFSGFVPVFWVNSGEQAFTFPSEYASMPYKTGIAYGITVSGTDVYAVGEEDWSNADNNGTPILWKNNVATVLTQTAPGIFLGGVATAIAVANNNVYISGYINGDSGSHPVTWLNGVMSQLPQQTAEAQTHSIAINGTDVYIAGEDGENTTTACYWKNGTQVALTDGTHSASTYGIALVKH